MTAPARNPSPHEPIEMLREAIQRCPYPVSGWDPNVFLGSQYWQRESNGPVSLIGAYLLVVQPAPDDDDHDCAPDPLGCAARSLGCAALFLEGVDDAFAGAPDQNRLDQWEPGDPRAQQYKSGLFHGKKLREETGR
jgi:hypothetical protein